MSQNNDANGAPTATEFIPADENGVRDDEGAGVRNLQATADGGLELVNEEPYDGNVTNHVFICDECGQDENLESDMAFHIRTQH